jgi:uncharacterized repeat protein (TIGR01451 family)
MNISRKIALTGVSRYSSPHITVWTDSRISRGLVNRVESDIVEYTINVQNDGDRSLGPVYIQDTFPDGTQYIDSSLRPVQQANGFANWTIVSLGIGSKSAVTLRLNITEQASGLVNTAEAFGVYSGGIAEGRNITSIERGDFLPCCTHKLIAEKTAYLDRLDPTVIHFNLSIKNQNAQKMSAKIVDLMPDGMEFLAASVAPSESINGRIIWTLTEIFPGQERIISYSAKAKRNGAFTNQAHIEAYAMDGSGSDSTDAIASIVVSASSNPARTTRYGGNWQPAEEFGLNTTDEGFGPLDSF